MHKIDRTVLEQNIHADLMEGRYITPCNARRRKVLKRQASRASRRAWKETMYFLDEEARS